MVKPDFAKFDAMLAAGCDDVARRPAKAETVLPEPHSPVAEAGTPLDQQVINLSQRQRRVHKSVGKRSFPDKAIDLEFSADDDRQMKRSHLLSPYPRPLFRDMTATGACRTSGSGYWSEYPIGPAHADAGIPRVLARSSETLKKSITGSFCAADRRWC
ncbi:hypothetical protein IDJ81_06840 [Tsuneonella flava]|uniref:Uncharacterized protein n=1 Tax=Tsuneonella flava TaxID=2055955 RepID=A0ABX7KCQ1_9SPHN|nr:hypothetical protein [Tsuneonella flava]QSB45799.1 hypothetical protein IDJ81_06840 [Tsuneonella flava]